MAQESAQMTQGRPSRIDDCSVPERADVALLVAHPDDETLWAGGILLMHRGWSKFIGTLCRASDPDRAPRFFRVLDLLGAKGVMADLDDGSAQAALLTEQVHAALLTLLPRGPVDLIITHAPNGEYTRHLRHEEVSRSVLEMWASGAIQARELWLFAYEDQGGRRLPCADVDADVALDLPDEIWAAKRSLLTEIYGLAPDSWEVQTTPRQEAFFRLVAPDEALDWLERGRSRK